MGGCFHWRLNRLYFHQILDPFHAFLAYPIVSERENEIIQTPYAPNSFSSFYRIIYKHCRSCGPNHSWNESYSFPSSAICTSKCFKQCLGRDEDHFATCQGLSGRISAL